MTEEPKVTAEMVRGGEAVASNDFAKVSDWIVDGRTVGEIWANGGHWLHDRGDFPLVSGRPLPGETECRHLDIARISFPDRPRGALVFRGPVIRDQVVGRDPRSKAVA